MHYPGTVIFRMLLPLFVAAALGASDPAAGIDAALGELSKVTGFQTLRKIESDTINQTQLKAFLEQRMKEEVKPQELRAEELALKKFGLVPQDFDLARTTIDLLTEQAAAFYDYRRKKLFVLEGPESTAGADAVMVHELAHALADQHHDLGKFLRRGGNDDATLARMAVMEGQATWLMYELMVRRTGKSLLDSPSMLDAMSRGNDGGAAGYPVLAAAPLYIRASLLFPYTQGMRFHNAVVKQFGPSAFGRVFRQPPLSTQQILHPEKYVANETPRQPSLPALTRRGDWKTLTEGTVGEFDHSVLVEQYLDRQSADRIAPEWRGGTMAVLEHKQGKRLALLYASEWKDAAAAGEFFDAYQSILRGKWKTLQVTSSSDSSFEGQGDDGYFRVTRVGTRVTAIEGLESSAVGTGLN